MEQLQIIPKKDAMKILQTNPNYKKAKYCAGKYKWYGTAKHYEGRKLDKLNDVIAVYVERRQDKDGAFAQIMAVVE